MDCRNPDRDVTPEFMARVADWLSNSGEVLVVLRYLRAAGSKAVGLCTSMPEFERLVARAAVGTDILVFRDRQLPLRGTVDKSFTAQVLQVIEDGQEYLVISLARQPGSCLSVVAAMGDSHADLQGDLGALAGRDVAVGLCPQFSGGDHERLVSAAKGGVDGPR